jgi:hypothetical protein
MPSHRCRGHVELARSQRSGGLKQAAECPDLLKPRGVRPDVPRFRHQARGRSAAEDLAAVWSGDQRRQRRPSGKRLKYLHPIDMKDVDPAKLVRLEWNDVPCLSWLRRLKLPDILNPRPYADRTHGGKCDAEHSTNADWAEWMALPALASDPADV